MAGSVSSHRDVVHQLMHSGQHLPPLQERASSLLQNFWSVTDTASVMMEPFSLAHVYNNRRTANLRHEGADIDIEQLLQACRRHEPLAWEALVRMYQNRLYALCYGYLRNSAEAEEVAQEAFVQVFRNLHQFSGPAAGFEPWLFAITRHCCIDRRRHNQARLPAGQNRAGTDAWPDDDAVPDPGTTPEQTLVTDQEHRMLYRALQETSEETRDLILLRDIQGLKIEEVATILGMPIGTVKSKCHRAKLELAKILVRLSAEGAST
ncbi:MAG: sigma-70 family RNA polymerase sigma factor [Gammaproteobacteria bacterium]|nr:sigma-70 family RNA polymerase sigma factor [Gammaproteobacteria bacterium]